MIVMDEQLRQPAGSKRKLVRFLVFSFALLILIGLQLFFRFRHDTIASFILGAIVLVAVVAILVWARRNNLLRRHRSR